ncbi:Thymidylate synthase complementing protein ThyX [Syntrophobacter sp. SbD1]|nr:Thymidylate synthase complementing protein ThyX [Syntrophobacter sp. SbD1]
MSVQFVKNSVSPYGLAPCEEDRALGLVELCGRTAYKSEEKITEDSAKKFVLMLKSQGHLSVLEHSNIVLKVEKDTALHPDRPAPVTFAEILDALSDRLAFHRLFPVNSGSGFLMTGNFRAWVETLDRLKRMERIHGFLLQSLNRFFPALFPDGRGQTAAIQSRASLLGEEEQLELLKTDPSLDLPVFVFKFVCDRGITHEVVRHRVFSFTQESTRYVNYGSKGMVLILPEELYNSYDDEKGELSPVDPMAVEWRKRAEVLFHWYMEDLQRGLRPEIARDILPNLLKSEIFVSGRWSGWKHFILLRDSSKAHPRIRFLAKEVRKYFAGLGLEC